MRILLIGVGGFVGSILRYGMGTALQGALPAGAFPIGTLLVNVLGCFAIGVLSGISEARGVLSPELRALLVVGLLGGFTTFSAFANETVVAARAGAMAMAAANVLLSVAACLAAAWAGRLLVS
jgi:CrcB protein